MHIHCPIYGLTANYYVWVNIQHLLVVVMGASVVHYTHPFAAGVIIVIIISMAIFNLMLLECYKKPCSWEKMSRIWWLKYCGHCTQICMDRWYLSLCCCLRGNCLLLQTAPDLTLTTNSFTPPTWSQTRGNMPLKTDPHGQVVTILGLTVSAASLRE